MKKKIILLCSCFLATIFLFSLKGKVEAYEIDNLLGKTINCVKSESYGDIASMNAIDETFCHSLKYEFSRFNGKTNYSYKSSLSYSKMKKEIQGEYSINVTFDNIPVKMFTLGGYSSFETSIMKEKENNASTAYTQVVATKKYGTFSLYSDEHLKFKDHLTQSFLNDLDRAYDFTDNFDFVNLFDKYGTHFINNYTYGDNMFIELSMYSNDVMISDSINARIASSLNASVEKASGCMIVKEAISHAYSNHDYEINTVINSYTSSNNMLIEIGENDNIIEKVKKWDQKTNKDNGTITSINSNQLIPIWDCIPDKYNALLMKNEFIKYAKDNEFEYDESNTHVFNDIKGNVNVRDEDLKIKALDRFNYSERLYLNVNYGVSIIKDKYSKLTLKVKMKAWKYSPGSRYLYIYDEKDVEEKNHSKYLTYNTDDIKVSSRKSSAPDDVEFELVIYTGKLSSLNLYLVWRASGKGNDTWHNSKVSIDYTFKAKGELN